MADIQSDKTDSPTRETAGTRLAAKRAAKSARKAASRGTTNAVEEAANTVAQEATAWMDKHGRKVLLVVGAALLVAIVGVVIANLSARKDREAGTLLESAVTTAQGLVVPADEPQPEEPLSPVFPSVKEREDKALRQFREVTKKYPDSPAATYAKLGAANAQLRLGQYAQASAAFERLRSAAGPDTDTFVRFRVLEGAGYALEGEEKYAEARERFEALSRLDNGAYRVLGDYHRARMLVAEGKPNDAKKVLEELTKAEADKPLDLEQGAGPSFESALTAAQLLLTELGGKPAEHAGGASGISQQVLDSLRKQIGKSAGTQTSK